MIRARLCYRDGHYYFILNDPDKKGKVLSVNMTSYLHTIRRKNSTCILEIADHPCITKKSVINYSDARISLASEIQKDIDLGLIKIEKELISEALLNKILTGLTKSDNLAEEVEDFAKKIFPNLTWL
jgi:hypothetical protein